MKNLKNFGSKMGEHYTREQKKLAWILKDVCYNGDCQKLEKFFNKYGKVDFEPNNDSTNKTTDTETESKALLWIAKNFRGTNGGQIMDLFRKAGYIPMPELGRILACSSGDRIDLFEWVFRSNILPLQTE